MLSAVRGDPLKLSAPEECQAVPSLQRNINMNSDEYLARLRKTIKEHNLTNWLNEYEWLTGHLGNPLSSVWFVAENPSLKPVATIDKLKPGGGENLQWNCYAPETKMFRNALTKAGLKTGDLCTNTGWNCYITNAVKAPDFANNRNKTMNAAILRNEARIWWSFLQYQIDNGKPAVIVPLGKRSRDLIEHMRNFGLKTSAEIHPRIYHYSYIMKYYDNKTKRNGGDQSRVKDFETSILEIARRYDCRAAPNPQ